MEWSITLAQVHGGAGCIYSDLNLLFAVWIDMKGISWVKEHNRHALACEECQYVTSTAYFVWPSRVGLGSMGGKLPLQSSGSRSCGH